MLTEKVLSLCNLPHPRLHHSSPYPIQRCTMQAACPAPSDFSAHQIILSSSPRHVPQRPGHCQLLPLLPDRPCLRAAQLHGAHFRDVNQEQTLTPGTRCAGTGRTQQLVSASCLAVGMLVYATVGASGPHPGGFWVECVGDVDAGGGVVCLVAGVDGRDAFACKFFFC